ncbi:MAG: hypothetical protein ACK6DB_12470, partial [Planctomycetota bacterium]
NILEGLTTRDFGLIISGAEEVERITQAEAWNSNDFADYQKISEELRIVCQSGSGTGRLSLRSKFPQRPAGEVDSAGLSGSGF